MQPSTGVSVMIFTLNEEINLPNCLASLGWCDDVIVIDSFSADRTEEIARQGGARFFTHRFEGFGQQRSWGLHNAQPRHEWVLILDADERVPPELADELLTKAREAPDEIGAYRVRRRFYMWGQWLRHSSLYPTWVVRFVRRHRVTYLDRGHAETQHVKGKIADLAHDLIDENLKGLDEWFERQNRYSTKEAQFELENETSGFNFPDLFSHEPLVRRAALKRIASCIPGRSFVYFMYSYVWRRGFLDGRHGFVYCRMRALYEAQVSIKKYDLRKKRVERPV